MKLASVRGPGQLTLPVAPPVTGTRPALKEPSISDGARSQALFAALRRRLAVTGTGLGPTPPPRPAPHRDPVLTLVHRITQGFSRSEYERARALGYEAYLEEQLEHLAIDDSAMDARLEDFPTLQLSPKQLYETYNANFTTPYFEFKGAALLRAVHSRRQLFERMVEFWNDHFCIDQNKGDLEWVFLPEHDRDVIRAHALGSFPAMLSACAHGAAMLYYLDNWLNVAGEVQENYARELLELHTLGVHGGYNEFDVTEVARCFTGWTLNLDPNSNDYLRGRFELSLHDGGKKLVLGQTIPATPRARSADDSTAQREAQRVIDIASHHPSTAEFLARKLVRWFLSDDPAPELVARVAETYSATHGDIRSMLRVILARENMGALSGVRRPRFRRPFHYMATTLRALEVDVRDPNESVLFFLPAMGHMPFDHVQPNGYPDTIAAWGTSPLPRWTFASQLLRPGAGFSQGLPGLIMPNFLVLRARLGIQSDADRPGLAQRINERLLGEQLPPYELEALQQFIDDYPGTFDVHAFYDWLTTAVSLPGFQWY
jgi:uncharacterized protein (DUF1800 family)